MAPSTIALIARTTEEEKKNWNKRRRRMRKHATGE
jgi:hypothetical protein